MEQQTLEQQVWNEKAIMELLGIEKRTLDKLRLEDNLPFVRLTAKARVYLADDVLNWVKDHRRSVEHV